MKFLKILALLVIAVVGVALPAQAKAIAAPSAIQGIFRATDTGASSVSCVTHAGWLSLGERHGDIMGLTDRPTRRVWYDQRRVCSPLEQYLASGELDNWAVMALATIGHEAAHLRSVDSERRAECLGVRFAWAWMGRHGVFQTYNPSGIRDTLLNDGPRPAAYKLNGTCTVMN
jgi:hypothetical protein